MTGLFILLILTFVINPIFFNRLQDNLLGKIIIISTLIYLTMNNVTLGLLFTLILIILSHRSDNYSLIEGLKNKRKNSKNIKQKKNLVLQAKLKAERAKAKAAKAEAEAKAKAAKAEAEAAQAEELDAIDTNNFAEFEDMADIDMNIDLTETFENGVDRLSIEDTFRVKNPSTIPTSKEQFSIMGNIMPFDNNMQLFGGLSSFV